MKILLFLVLLIVNTAVMAQDTPGSLVKQGVILHDKGLYDEAIAKYDEAISMDKNHYLAYYEKSYSFMMQKKYDECIKLSRYILENFKNGPDNAAVYINYGTCFDYLKQPIQALDIYNQGIGVYPEVALLYFNKAVTLANMNKLDEAMDATKQSILHNPRHASSHNIVSLLVMQNNKIYSLLASLVFLMNEPAGKRAEMHLKNVEKVLNANVTKTGKIVSLLIFLPPH